jgi:ribulose-phosphate 3-epimerase
LSVRIAPSILAADFGNLAGAARACAEGGADSVHFDVMDGQFVPNISFGALPIRALRPHSTIRFEAHLMIVQPERWIEEFVEAGADLVTVQVEACTHVQRILAQIRAAGAKAGLALNPGTPLDVLDWVLDDIDLVLIMTVNPGFGGQSYLPAMTRKIRDARRILNDAANPIELQVDGGIGVENAALVVEAGATILVAGTSIFGNAAGPAEGIRALRQAATKGT